MRHIVMAVTNDLVTDQRVDRSCKTLVEAGFAVTLIGRKLAESESVGSRNYSTKRMRLAFRRSALFYAEYNLRLFLKLMFSKADAFYANDTDTLLACCMAARVRRKKLFFDAHELFPDVPELVGKPGVQKVWRWVEKKCLPHVDAAFTVCQSVADEYKQRYGTEMTVLRNLPERGGRAELQRSYSGATAKVLYQGAVNVGRGVRELIDAMRWLPNCELVVAGNGDIKADLEEYSSGLEWRSRIKFLGRVAPAQLHQLTCTADLGVCLLEDLGLNYRYSLPNRIADFAQAGVPILATNFVEISRVINEYGTGALTEPCPQQKSGEDYHNYVKNLALTIGQTIDFWRNMDEGQRTAIFARAGEELCWDKEKKKLINIIDTIFD